jgi:Pretoxin HINT domain
VITVTAEDRAIGYDTAAGSAKFGATVLISTLGPGAVSNVAKGFGGARAVCTTGKVLAGLDAASNSVDVGKGVADMRQNGLTFGNALQVGGGLLGLAGNANTILNTACFAAGTPLLTPDGSKFIEDFRVGDLVLSRHEDDPEGPVVAKRVVNLFQNYSPLLDLQVGERVIRTTAEHPFWVVGRGWTAAQQVVAGDLLLGPDDEQTVVTLVEGPKESAPVYNLEIEEYHTYLVRSALWGFSVWAHNSDCAKGIQANKKAGDAARDKIAAREAPALIEQSFTTVGGVRRVDVLKEVDNLIGIESKVGRTALGSRERQELARDWWLVRQGQLDGVKWEFSVSEATGKIGPTPSLAAMIEKLGFGLVINNP